MIELGLKPRSPGSKTHVFPPCWLAVEMAAPGSLSTLTLGYDLGCTRHTHVIRRGSWHFKERVSGRCQVPWPINQSFQGCVWWFLEKHPRWWLKVQALMPGRCQVAQVARAPSLQTPHSLAAYPGQDTFLSFLFWYLPPWAVRRLPRWMKCLEQCETNAICLVSNLLFLKDEICQQKLPRPLGFIPHISPATPSPLGLITVLA